MFIMNSDCPLISATLNTKYIKRTWLKILKLQKGSLTYRKKDFACAEISDHNL